MLAQTRAARAALRGQEKDIVRFHPLHLILDSMPGLGIRTQAKILTEVVGKDFATPGYLAAHAGDAEIGDLDPRRPFLRKGQHDPQTGLVPFLVRPTQMQGSHIEDLLREETCRGKKHEQAVIALPRRRCNVLFAMLPYGTVYEAPESTVA